MAESVFSSNLSRSMGIVHALLPSRVLREFVTSSGKAWTWSKNSMPRTILKSSIGTMEKSSFPLHVPRVVYTPCAIPAIGFVGEFTAFIVPYSLVALRPNRLASSMDTKLCVAPVSCSMRMDWSFIFVLTYISHFFVSASYWRLSVPSHWREPMLSWDSSADIVGLLLSWAAKTLSDFFFGQLRTQWGSLHMKHVIRGFGASFLPSDFSCLLLLLGGFFCLQFLRFFPLSLRLSPLPLPWLALLSIDWVAYSESDSAIAMASSSV